MQKGRRMLKWSTVSRLRTTKEELQKKKPRKPHSTVLNRRDRRFVLVPVQICPETQPATASLFPTTAVESQRIGYDLVRKQPSRSECTCNNDERNLPWRWTVPEVHQPLGASNRHHTMVKRQRSFTPHHVYLRSCKRAKHFKL